VVDPKFKHGDIVVHREIKDIKFRIVGYANRTYDVEYVDNNGGRGLFWQSTLEVFYELYSSNEGILW